MTTTSAHRRSSKVLMAIILVILLSIGVGVVVIRQLNQPSNSTKPKVTPVVSHLTEKWTGPWTNSLGEHGDDTLEITDDGAGNIQGLWSGTINVTGQWLNKTSIKFSGRTSTRDYQVQGTIQGDTLILNYTATRLDTSGTYSGEEKLTRVSP